MSTEPIEVVLDEVEMASTLQAATALWEASRTSNMRDARKARNMTSEEINKMGIVAERVAAKVLDLYWSGANRTFKRADLSHAVEVRSTRNPHLLARVTPGDADDKRVISIYMPDGIEAGRYLVMGWIEAGVAKVNEWWENRHNCWYVPAEALRPIDELRRLIDGERLHGPQTV